MLEILRVNDICKFEFSMKLLFYAYCNIVSKFDMNFATTW